VQDPAQPFRWVLLVSSLLTFSFLVASLVEENYLVEWRVRQREYQSILEQKATDELGRALLRNYHIGLRQISVPALQVVDRCVTCHLAIDDPRMSDVRQPFRTHPGDLLKSHPIERFGCTSCHLGQGRATSYRDAAHEPLAFWDEPMLKGKYLQASCGKCHLAGGLPQAALLSLGRTLYREEFACDTCHRINDEGGTECPELTHVGSKPLGAFDFAHVKGARTRQQWLFEHFQDPQAIVPDSLMPNPEMTEEQALALTVLMLSLTDDIPPFDYIMRPAAGSTLASAEAAARFEEKGCLLCHQFGSRGGVLGPDLASLTHQRNADWLFRHFKDPHAAVPGSGISPVQLSDAEANELTRYVLSVQ